MNREILVNKENPITSDAIDSLDLVEIYNSISIDRNCLSAWIELQRAAYKDGLNLIIDECYRSLETQQNVLNYYINLIGKDAAYKRVAFPGESEHHTGLAIDYTFIRDDGMIEDKELTENDKEYIWMNQNAYKYGFIIRYPKGKEDITGYNFEPWHIRYVGKELALYLKENDITLEEYYQNKKVKTK